MPLPTWIVVADAARARIFHTDAELSTWTEAAELSHPASRADNTELLSDTSHNPSGTGASGHGPRSDPPTTDQHDEEATNFARKLTDHLDDQVRAFDAVVLVAAPSFLGKLRPLISKRLEAKITVQVDKDYSNHSAQDVRKYVGKALAEQPLVG